MNEFIYAPDQQFYYYLVSLACFGFWASAYGFLHTGKRAWEHTASSIMLMLFTLTILMGILGVGGDLPIGFSSNFSLWILLAVVLYVCVKAIDRMIENNARRQQLYKDEEFNKQMKKAEKKSGLNNSLKEKRTHG